MEVFLLHEVCAIGCELVGGEIIHCNSIGKSGDVEGIGRVYRFWRGHRKVDYNKASVGKREG